MPNITPYSHFTIYPVRVSNIGATGSSPEASIINDLVTYLEPEYLQKILGYEEFTAFMDAKDDVGNQYYKLLNGDTYTDLQGRTQEWYGFVNTGKNPIANYVFWHYLKQMSSSVNGIGVVQPNTENSTLISPKQAMVTAWNQMVELNFKLHDYITANADLFPDYIGFTYAPYYSSYTVTQNDNQYLFIKQNLFDL